MSLKYRTLIGIVVVIWLIAAIGPFAGTLQSAEWRPLGKDIKDCQWFYDEANIRHLSGNKKMVWLKRMVKDEERRQLVRKRSETKRPLNGYDRWAYELGLMELNCTDKTIRQLNVTDYDRDGKYLESRKISDNLSIIAGDSIADMAYGILCPPKNYTPLNRDIPFTPLR